MIWAPKAFLLQALESLRGLAAVVYSAQVSGALCIAATSQCPKNGLTDDRQLDQQAAPSYRYHVIQLVAIFAAVCSADCHIGPPASLRLCSRPPTSLGLYAGSSFSILLEGKFVLNKDLLPRSPWLVWKP